MFKKRLKEHEAVTGMLALLEDPARRIGDFLADALTKGNKILICGNGGSAADSQHFAAEIIGRFQMERSAWPAVALTTDTSILTAIGNDYGFDQVFVRQVEGLGRPGDVLVGISTSGNSSNVVEAVKAAAKKGMMTVGMLGGTGGKLNDLVDYALVVPDSVTARVQEGHIFLIHYLAEHIEARMGES